MLPRLISVGLLAIAWASAEPLVKSKVGQIEGFEHLTESREKTDVFLGIPFAKPPVGELRFEKPEPHPPFNQKLRAKKFGLSCPAHHDHDTLTPEGEDCLTLNIIRPSKKSVDPAGYPVAFWIHPGGYCIGASAWFGYESIAEHLATRGIIVVTINYRLGYFGFASTGDEVLPGNLGLFDQALALKWVHDNIDDFGGDPEKVTAWGLSAGGASVSQLALSPYTRDLFRYAVQLSGSFYAPWTTSEQVVQTTKGLAKLVHCPTGDSVELKRCLKTKSWKELSDAQDAYGMGRTTPNLGLYSPRLDGDFFPKDYPELLKEVKPKPTFLGSAQDEAHFFAVYNILPTLSGNALTAEEMANFDAATLTKKIRETIFVESEYGKNSKKIQDRIIDFYVKRNAPAGADPLFYVNRYSQIFTHTQFFVPMLYELVDKHERGWPLFQYHNQYYLDHHFPEGTELKGAVHAAELKTIFDTPIVTPYTLTAEDRQHRELLLGALERFIKTGDPSSTNLSWPQSTKSEPFKHMKLHTNAELKDSYDKEVVDFWLGIRKEFGEIVVRNIHYGDHAEGGKFHGEL